SSPNRRNTTLCGSWASWAERVRTSSMGHRSHPREHLRRAAHPAHFFELRHLFGRCRRERLPLRPLLDGLAEPAEGDERVAEEAVRRRERRIEPQGAPQLLTRFRRAAGGE